MTPAIASALEAHNQRLERLRAKVATAKQLMREGADLRAAAVAVDLPAAELDRLLWKSLGNPMRDL